MFRPARTALWTVHEVYECHFKVSNLKAYTWQIDGESATQIKVLSCPHIALFQVAGWFRKNIFLTVQGWGRERPVLTLLHCESYNHLLYLKFHYCSHIIIAHNNFFFCMS